MAEQVDDDKKFTGVFLPVNVKPHHYDLSLKPDLKKFTFDGLVRIDYTTESSSPIKEVVLHALQLKITKGFAQKEVDTVSTLKKVTYSKESETATLEFSEPIPDKGSLALEFIGELNDKMHGFYRTSFKLDDTDVYAATTQFEPTHARRCFPCWDEPAKKATFSVTLTYGRLTKTKAREYPNVALSNMPIIEQTADSSGDVLTVKYDKTPIMSTYLLAIIVGPFECVEGTDGQRQHRVFTTPGKKDHALFALDVSIKSLLFYEKYFDIGYPLKKFDNVAIPDFTNGAMENWGLVTYRESSLLVDPKNTATLVKQNIALTVAHEIAHQWFGNLVTMEWWTHLWLNEGFATFMEFLCVDDILPEYDIWSQFASDVQDSALNLDSLHNSHPIEVPVQHPSEIDEIFDTISYLKGASVNRMLYQYIGDECFRKGMHDYLSKYAYKNTVTENLWECLEKASNKPICRIMSDWTSQKGFPWLSVKCSQEGDNSVKLSLTQNKFTADGTMPADATDLTWLIPLEAVTGNNPEKTVSLGLFEGRENVVTVEGAKDTWVKLNPSCVGLYRTAYPDEMLKKLWAAVSEQTLPAIDRFGLQSDFYALCQAGHVKTTELLKLMEAYKGETHYTVWCSIDGSFGHLNLLLSNTDYQDKFHLFGKKLYSEIFKKVTWTPRANEKHTDSMFRPLILNRLVSIGDESVIEEAKRKYKAHVDGLEIIPADLRSAVYRAIARFGSDEDFNRLFEIHSKTELNEEKNRVLSSLGFSKDSSRLDRAVKFALSDAVKDQDKMRVFFSIGASNPNLNWEIFKEKKDVFRSIYEIGHLLTWIVKHSCQNLASEEKAQEVSKFFEVNKFPGCERTIQQAIETIRLNANWLSRDSEAIKAFLSE